MIFTPDLSSEQAIIDGFQGAQAGQPLVPGQIEFIPEGIRVFGSTTNEKYLGLWWNLEPERFPFYEGWKRGSMRYRLRIGEDVPAASAFNGGKWPGLIGTYDLWSESVLPPSPAPSAFATWEARVWYGDWDGETYGTGTYYYGVRGPRLFVGSDGQPTNVWFPGAVHVDTPGTPTSVGKFYGSGTQGGIPRANVRIKPGVWYTFEEQLVLNSVKDKTLFIDTLYPNGNEAYEKCLANANEDGILRLLVDDVLVYEATKVAFRGLDKIGIQSAFVNYYDGGRGQYPKFPAPIEFGSLTLSDEVQGGGVEPVPDHPTQAEKDATLAELDHAIADIEAARATVESWPVGGGTPPPPDPQTIDSFVASPMTLPAGGGEVMLDWTTSHATSVALDGDVVEFDGQLMVDVTTTQTFTLTASGSVPPISQAVTVGVAATIPGDLPVPSPLPPPLPPESALGSLVAGMPPNSWAELSPQFLQQVIGSASQSGNVIPYANSAAYDAHNAEIVVVAADHLVQPRVCVYSLETNRWRGRRYGPGPDFIHAYQHTAAIGGVRYYRTGASFLADNNTRNWVLTAPPNISIAQVITVALSVWNNLIYLYDGNGGQFAVYDPFADAWLPPITGIMPEMGGVYHVVAAATPHGIVYGGGNGGNAPSPNKILRRLNADHTSTRLPDAPFGIGIFSQANLVSADDGNVYALGFGQHWKLNPSGAGKWCRLPDPPSDLIRPESGQGFISCSAPGCVVYLDAGYGRAARMRIYKPG